MRVGPALKSDSQFLTHGGMCPIASGNVGSLAAFFGCVCAPEMGEHPSRLIFETQELRLTLDVNAGFSQTLDQKTLVFVLGKNQGVRIGTDIGPDVPKHRARDSPAADPKIYKACFPPTLNQRVGQPDLPVELERPRLHGKGTRGSPWF